MARSRQAKTGPVKYVGIQLDSDMSEGLKRLEQGIYEKVLRSAAHAGALEFYNEMRIRVPIDEGQLHASIYRWYDDKRSTPQQAIYLIGPNKAKAPHWHLVEYGHWRVNVVFRRGNRWIATRERLPAPKWVQASPYIRPTFDARINSSITLMKSRMAERVRELISEVAV